jgi:hypothetical protein
MLKRKILSKIGVVSGILAFLMLFVIPFIFIKITGTDSKFWAGIFFFIFLVFTAVANISLEKSEKPLSLEELREEKIRQIIK